MISRWESFDAIFRSLNWIRVRGQFALYPQGLEVLESEAAVIVQEKRRWDNRPKIEENGICLSTLLENFHHLQCSNILDKVYGLLGLSSDADKLEVDYRKSPQTVYGEVLELVCRTQLVQIHTRMSFEKVLLNVFGLVKEFDSILSVENILQTEAKQRKALEASAKEDRRLAMFGQVSGEPLDEQPSTEWTRPTGNNIYRTSQPVLGESELEVSIDPFLRSRGTWNIPQPASPFTSIEESESTPRSACAPSSCPATEVSVSSSSRSYRSLTSKQMQSISSIPFNYHSSSSSYSAPEAFYNPPIETTPFEPSAELTDTFGRLTLDLEDRITSRIHSKDGDLGGPLKKKRSLSREDREEMRRSRRSLRQQNGKGRWR